MSAHLSRIALARPPLRLVAPSSLILLVSGCLMVPPPTIMEGVPADGGAPDQAPVDAMPNDRVDEIDDDDFDGSPPDGSADRSLDAQSPPDDDGRDDGAMPEPRPARGVRPLPPAPAGCPGGSVGWLPGLAMCVVVVEVDALPAPRHRHFGVRLGDGTVWVGGGADHRLATSETWLLDAVDGEWSPGPPLPTPVVDAAAVVLPDGSALVIGGRSEVIPSAVSQTAVVQRLVEGEVEPLEPMMVVRGGEHAAHRLPDGRVLVLGGQADVEPTELEVLSVSDCDAACPETGPMGVARAAPASTLDADGALWVLGGLDGQGRARFAPERLAPGASEWVSVPGQGEWAFFDGAAAVIDGAPMFAGGVDDEGRALDRAGRFDAAADAWGSTGALNHARGDLSLVPLGERSAVVVGGHGPSELFDPVDALFYAFDQRTLAGQPRSGSATVRMADGAVLVAGGEAGGRPMPQAFVVRLVSR